MKPQAQTSIHIVAVRIILYGIVLVAVAQLISLEALQNEMAGAKYGENSLTEIMQIIFLCLTFTLFLWCGRIAPSKRSLCTLLAGFAMVACIRELDNILDKYVFDGAWQLLVVILLVTIIFLVYLQRDTLKEAIVDFLNQPSFGIIVSGFLIIFTFSII